MFIFNSLLPLVRGWTRKRVNVQYSFKHLKNHDIYVSGIWRQGRWLLLVFVQLSIFLTERLIFLFQDLQQRRNGAG